MIEEFAEITALIADRATLFRHGLRGLLKEHRPDWSCAEAGSQDEMLAHLHAEPVDLLLFDMQLGGSPLSTSCARTSRIRRSWCCRTPTTGRRSWRAWAPARTATC